MEAVPILPFHEGLGQTLITYRLLTSEKDGHSRKEVVCFQNLAESLPDLLLKTLPSSAA